MRAPATLLSLFVALLLSGCISTSDPSPSTAQRVEAARALADSLAQEAGLTANVLPLSPFAIQSYARGQADSVTIYIEGDGYAWIHTNRPSPDPTPRNPLALRLAAQDSSPAVAYLARPCQYVASPACSTADWTNARFSQRVITAMNEAVTVVKAQADAQQIHLVGYSGGGAVAALIASKRSDIASLRTVAGYLDHVALNAERGVSPLTGSLDPMAVAADLSSIPQMHFSGSADTLIPQWVAEDFVEAQGTTTCASVQTVPNAGHQSGWEASWPALLQVALPCWGSLT